MTRANGILWAAPRLASEGLPVYPFGMAERAKLFRRGGNQVVWLPQNCRFPDDQREVVVRKVGRRVILEPVDAWPQSFLECIGAWRDEIPRPKSDPVRTIKEPFA